ncbi:hypothetical protein MESMUL_05940 [Mesosutterella multiformis]|uniref:Uncharacterized protein n=1 Tax=Mesosutterella multiformis TaxID=2259133 RepID=A0A388SCU0_9BURK|nr:hypothetical protein MESMUL_05940 [Mesosutterella multiformis]
MKKIGDGSDQKTCRTLCFLSIFLLFFKRKNPADFSAGFLVEGEENFVGDSEIIALGGASNETKDRPLG